MPDWMDNIERLGNLRDKGLITEEEFKAERNKLLPTTAKPSSGQEETANTSPQSSAHHKIPKSAKWNLGGLTAFLSSILMILVLIHVWRIVTHVQRWNLANDFLDGKSITLSQADTADTNVLASFSLAVIVHIVWLTLMIVWAWRATDNLECWDKNPRWGKGWAIGGWFTPIGNLFIPYQIVSDAWRRAPSKDLSYQPKRNWWWLTGWLSWWIGLVTIYAAFAGSESLEGMRDADAIAVAGISIQILSALTMTQAINEISQRHAKAAMTL